MVFRIVLQSVVLQGLEGDQQRQHRLGPIRNTDSPSIPGCGWSDCLKEPRPVSFIFLKVLCLIHSFGEHIL